MPKKADVERVVVAERALSASDVVTHEDMEHLKAAGFRLKRSIKVSQPEAASE